MSDRELLELAARAAGIETFRTSAGNLVTDNNGKSWNPLTDDGDALRLAVKLTLEIDICRTGIAVRTPNGIKVLIEAGDDPDAYSATRRAIVRAAAEIGRAMP